LSESKRDERERGESERERGGERERERASERQTDRETILIFFYINVHKFVDARKV
jgi:hypothetical protein